MSTLTSRRVLHRTLTPASGCHVESRGPNWLIVSVETPRQAYGLADRLWRLVDSQFVYRVVLRFEDAGHFTEPYERHQLAAELRSLYNRLAEHDGLLRLCGLEPELAALVLEEIGCPRLHNHASAHDAVWGGELEEGGHEAAACCRD